MTTTREIWFTTTRTGQRRAYYFCLAMFRAFPMPLAGGRADGRDRRSGSDPGQPVEAVVTTVQYALEADPGRCTASFPTFDTLEAAATAASFPAMYRQGIPPPRLLVRRTGGAWEPVALPLWWCPPCDAGIAGSCTCGPQ